MTNVQLVAAGAAIAVGFGILVLLLARPLLGLSRLIDKANTAIGQVVAWAILVAVLISAVNATVRKVFDTSSNAWLEMQWILFGAVFLICASWTMRANEHIRIDIVSNLLPRSVRSFIDFVGHLLFLIPTALLMLWTAWPFFLRSYFQNEQSTNAGGLAVYPSKFLVVLGFTLLLAQGLSELIKRAAIMRGLIEETGGGGHHDSAAAEAERLKQAIAEEAARHDGAKPAAKS